MSEPNSQRSPSLLSSEWTADCGIAAAMSHDTRISSSHAANSTTTSAPNIFLVLIRLQIVDVKDVQFQRTHYQSCGIDSVAAAGIWE